VTSKSLARPVIVLFRRDLRIADNRALAVAASVYRPVVPLFVHAQAEGRPSGAASRWWLHHSLTSLEDALKRLGAPLIVRTGDQAKIVAGLVDETGADTVLWNRRYDPPCADADRRLKEQLRADGLHAESFDGQLLHEPSLVKTGGGGPYKVYSPFWRALMAGDEPRDPVDAPATLTKFHKRLDTLKIDELDLLPTAPDWAGGLRDRWTPGEMGAHERLDDFLKHGLKGYGDGRDYPARDVTSRLSPHLAFGEITPFQIMAALNTRRGAPPADVEKFRKEVVWREFCHHLLFHNRDLATQNFNRDFDSFPSRSDRAGLSAWTRGRTGYPIVDAGMRELWQTGSMHNRVRMITASFLIKDLLVDWREGERWFWDTLVDADPASNAANWQWVAGSGADAAPYFRIFNPILQGEKFDPDGAYVREWLPELAKMPDRYIHKPWQADADTLRDAGVKLGTTYPVPVVDHGKARDRALAALRQSKGDT
jgi:deoxyribodipyrimidine photo-lyase